MSQPDSDRSQSRRILSALADGDATDGEASRAFEAWRADDDARSTWHAYQLIGDVLRSDDLASEPEGDRQFLLALRARLATEPVVLAPQGAAIGGSAVSPALETARPAVANGRASAWARGRWQAPLAMAAGFLAVIGGINLVRSPAGHGNEAAIAQVGQPASAVAGNVTATATSAQAKADADQLAPYLAAHRQSTMNAAFQMPGGDIRDVSLVQRAP